MESKKKVKKNAGRPCFSRYLFISILALSLVSSIFISAFSSVTFNRAYYEHQFAKRFSGNALQYFLGLNDAVLMYLENNKAMSALDDSQFSAREISHMADVKGLMRKIILFGISSAMAVLLSGLMLFRLNQNNEGVNNFTRDLANALRLASYAVALIVLIILVLSLNFDAFFTSFHLAAFSNDNWLLDENSLLITMYPENFFLMTFMHILLIAVVHAFALYCLARILRNFGSSKIKKHK